MKKIHNFINNHPKLKRVAKVLGVIAIVFSFLFNAVIITSAIITANNENIKHPLVYENINKPKKAVTTGSYIVVGLDELATNYYYEKTREYFSTYWDSPEDLGRWWVSPTWYDCDIVSVNIDMYQGLNDYDIKMAMRFDSGNIYFMWGDLQDYGSTQKRYRCLATVVSHWTDTNNNGYTLNVYGYSWFTAPFANDTQKPYENIFLQQSLSELSTSHRFYDLGLYIPHKVIDYGRQIDNQMYLFVYGSNAYNYSNYHDAWQVGYDYGYSNGLRDGYNEGQASQTSSPFALIRQAFSSLIDIFNIQLLPNLSLGVVIFTPLIVTIIIVVVKLIRG